MAPTAVHAETPAEAQELAVVYAALILHDDGITRDETSDEIPRRCRLGYDDRERRPRGEQLALKLVFAT
eukprot:tig00000342_g24204.t1